MINEGDAAIMGLIGGLFGPVREMIETGVDAVVVAAGREGTLPTIVSGVGFMELVIKGGVFSFSKGM